MIYGKLMRGDIIGNKVLQICRNVPPSKNSVNQGLRPTVSCAVNQDMGQRTFAYLCAEIEM